MSKSTKPAAGQELAVPLKFGIELDWHQSFTWKERLQVFIGYTMLFHVRVGCQHNPGEFIPLIEKETSPAIREKNKTSKEPDTKSK